MCVSERQNLYHTYSMYILYDLCIRKRETVSYLQYVHDLDFVYQKDGNCIIPTIYLLSRFCESESIRKRETVLFAQYIYDLDCVYHKEGSGIIPTVC